MSNQIGDRYTCSDPNCGCEIRIERPCSMTSQGTSLGAGETEIPEADTPSFQGATNAPHRPSISTPGDYGDQGATGEGVFGTSGPGRSVVGSGRYDSATTPAGNEQRALELGSSSSTRGTQGISGTLTCFCGNRMQVTSESSRAARGAGGL